MISAALLRRTLRDYLALWLGAALFVGAFVVLFNFAINAIPRQQSAEWLELPIVRRFITALVGADVLELSRPEGMLSIAFSHPLVWVLLIAFNFTLASGALAGEVDRGTMDLLAALPISRARIYGSISAALLLMGLPLCWMVWIGARIGVALTGAADVRMGILAIVACNLCAVYVLVCGLSLAIAAYSNRRGMAVAVAFAIVFYAFVINFLRAMWPALEPLAWTSFLRYYAPLIVIRDGAWPWGDMATLTVAGAIAWSAGLVVFVRRDFPAR